MKYLEVCLQTSIFAPLFNRKHISLDYGVMAVSYTHLRAHET